MEFYAPAELERVIHRSARLLDVEIDTDGAAEIAGRSRGTPRIANRLLRRVRDYAQVKADGVITREIAARRPRGLRGRRPRPRPARPGACSRPCSSCSAAARSGLSTLAVAVGEERETVEEVAEPFLVREGLLARTPRGRVATPAAWAHLGLDPARSSGRRKRTTGPVRGVTARTARPRVRNPGAMLGVVPSVRTRLDSADAALVGRRTTPP